MQHENYLVTDGGTEKRRRFLPNLKLYSAVHKALLVDNKYPRSLCGRWRTPNYGERGIIFSLNKFLPKGTHFIVELPNAFYQQGLVNPLGSEGQSLLLGNGEKYLVSLDNVIFQCICFTFQQNVSEQSLNHLNHFVWYSEAKSGGGQVRESSHMVKQQTNVVVRSKT